MRLLLFVWIYAINTNIRSYWGLLARLLAEQESSVRVGKGGNCETLLTRTVVAKLVWRTTTGPLLRNVPGVWLGTKVQRMSAIVLHGKKSAYV